MSLGGPMARSGNASRLWKAFAAAPRGGTDLTLETNGFPLRVSPNLGGEPRTSPLYLAGVGHMVQSVPGDMPIELCKVGIALSPEAMQRATQWAARIDNPHEFLSDQLLNSDHGCPSQTSHVEVVVMMHAVANLGFNYLHRAWRKRFRGSSRADEDSFFSALAEALQEHWKEGSALAFSFVSGGHMAVSVDGARATWICTPHGGNSLLESFLHPTDGVAPELYDSMIYNVSISNTLQDPPRHREQSI